MELSTVDSVTQKEEIQEDSEHLEDYTGQKASDEAFDYEAADYSLFQKGKNKTMKTQKIKEKFKGKVCLQNFF